MPRPQFTVRGLLVATLVVGAFFGGIQIGRELQRREDEEAALIAEAEVTAQAKAEADRWAKYGHLILQAEWEDELKRERAKAEQLANERVGTPPWVEDRRREAAERAATASH